MSVSRETLLRAAYLGPPGTNSHDALLGAGVQAEHVPFPTVAAVVEAIQQGDAERGLVPIENSREGGVGATLDALVFDAPDVRIVGELVHRVSYCLVAAEPIAPDEVCTVHSHPQATGQCAGFLARQLPAAAVVAASSTADAVRAVADGGALAGMPPHAAIGTRQAAALYGAIVLAEGIEDDAENATRFAWIARAGAVRPGELATTSPPAAGLGQPRTSAPSTAGPGRPATSPPSSAGPGQPAAAPPPTVAPSPVARLKTALVFWGGGDLSPGWLVACLSEFSSRSINLTRIESRPRRVGLGSYMFFCDLEGAASDPTVADAIAGLRRHCESVRVLGSFPASG
jgi:prephenate dehydratase